MNNLIKEAIADAKAVRESALANAKLALEEAFAPRLQSMLSSKLSEELEDDESEFEDEAPIDDAPVMDEPAPEAAPEPEPEPEMEEGFEGEEEDLDLEAIIRELDGDMEDENFVAEEEEFEMETEPELEEEDDMEVNLDELFNSLNEEDGEEEAPAPDNSEELEEAYRTIRFMRKQMNEVNMLNAKLLFSNKLFKNFELNETQKLRVIDNFDRATTLREVKLVYATLSEAFGTRNKTRKPIKESARASKPIRSTAPKREILDENVDFKSRMRKLAGLK